MKTKRHNYSKLFEIFRIRWLLKRRLLDEDKMIIWKIRIAIDKMKIIIRLFDYSIDFRIIEYLMPKYGHMRQYTQIQPIMGRPHSWQTKLQKHSRHNGNTKIGVRTPCPEKIILQGYEKIVRGTGPLWVESAHIDASDPISTSPLSHSSPGVERRIAEWSRVERSEAELNGVQRSGVLWSELVSEWFPSPHASIQTVLTHSTAPFLVACYATL